MDWILWTKLDGFIEPEEGFLLYNEVLQIPCSSRIWEIGCYHGKSTVAMLEACKDSSCTPDKKKMVSSVDPFIGQGMTDGEISEIEQYSGENLLWHTVDDFHLREWYSGVTKLRSDEWFAKNEALIGKIDMFFIDGLHPHVNVDIKNAARFLKPGGIIVCHDYWPRTHSLGWIGDLIDSAGFKVTRLGTTNLGKIIV